MGPARGVHNSLKIFYLPGLKQYSIYFLVLFDFCVFFNISPDPCPKLAKNDFNGGEKRVKTEGFEHIPTIYIFFSKILFENFRYSIYSRMIYIYTRTHPSYIKSSSKFCCSGAMRLGWCAVVSPP